MVVVVVLPPPPLDGSADVDSPISVDTFWVGVGNVPSPLIKASTSSSWSNPKKSGAASSMIDEKTSVPILLAKRSVFELDPHIQSICFKISCISLKF